MSKEILKIAEKLSPSLLEALKNDYTNRGVQIPRVLAEIIKLLPIKK